MVHVNKHILLVLKVLFFLNKHPGMCITYLEGIMFDSFCLIVDSPLVSAQAVSQIQSRRLQTVCYCDLSQLVSFQLNLFFY